MKKTTALTISFSLLLLGSIIYFIGCDGNRGISPQRETPQRNTSLKTCQQCNGVGRYGECASCDDGKVLDTYTDSSGKTKIRFATLEEVEQGLGTTRISRDDRLPHRLKHCEVCAGTGTRLCGGCNGRGTLP